LDQIYLLFLLYY